MEDYQDDYEKDFEKTQQITAIRAAFLQIEGVFTSIDIYNFINKAELAEKVPIDNIADALERFLEKGEVEVVEKGSPTKYRRTIEPEQ